MITIVVRCRPLDTVRGADRRTPGEQLRRMCYRFPPAGDAIREISGKSVLRFHMHRRAVLTLVSFLLVLLHIVCVGAPAVLPGLSAIARPAHASEETAKINVLVKDGLLTLETVDAPLGDVLQRIGEQAGFKAYGHNGLDELLTWSFTDVPLARALGWLTLRISSVSVYAPSGGLIELRILDAGRDVMGDDVSPGRTISTEVVSVEAEPNETDRIAEVRRRFEIVDKNGDGRVDQFEFRLKSIRMQDQLDTNRDGFVTIDETLLSPEKFKLLDSDGDGKISPVEFTRALAIIDTAGQGFITFEDYLAFVQVTAK